MLHTHVDHFVRVRGKLVAEAELVDTILFCGSFDLIVLFLRHLVDDLARWALEHHVHIVITTGHHLREIVVCLRMASGRRT